MMKKMIIGLFASLSLFVAVPAFAATEAEVVDTCTTQGTEACRVAIVNYIASLDAGVRATKIGELAASLAEKAVSFDVGARNVFTAAIAQLQQMPEAKAGLKAELAALNTSLATAVPIDTAAVRTNIARSVASDT